MEKALQQTIARQIEKMRTGLRNLEECIEVEMFSEKGLRTITANLDEVTSQIPEAGWHTERREK